MGVPCSGVTMHGCGNPAYNVYCWDHAHHHCHKPQPVAISYLAQYITRDEADQRYASSQDLFNLSSYIAYTYYSKESAQEFQDQVNADMEQMREDNEAAQNRLEGFVEGKVQAVQDYVQNQLVNSAEYNSLSKKIYFKNANNSTISELDAAPFVKDGMVDDVTIVDNNLNIVFNTDAGKQDILIPLSAVFHPTDYYTKDECNSLFVTVDGAPITPGGGGGGEGGSITVDTNLNRLSSNPVQNSAITAAINDLQQWTGRTGQTYTKDLTERISDAESGLVRLQNEIDNIEPTVDADSALSPTSTNPIQNKAVYNAVNDINTTLNGSNGVVPRVSSLEGSVSDLATTVDGIVTTGGEPNRINVIEVNGTAVTPVNKVVSISIPTDTVTQQYVENRFNDVLGINAEGVEAFVAATQDQDTATGILNEIGKKANSSDVYTKQEVNGLIQAADNFNPNLYYTKDDINNKGYLTSTALSGYATTASLATVATSGSYNDLSNKPTIPAAQQQVNWNATSGITSIANKPNLAVVATSGSYNDLSNKPTIPQFWTGTEAQYNNISTKDPNVFYCIYE